MRPQSKEHIHSKVKRLLGEGCQVFVRVDNNAVWYVWKDPKSKETDYVGFYLLEGEDSVVPEGLHADNEKEHYLEVLTQNWMREIIE